MSRNALLVNYQYCFGCHSCEFACRNHLQTEGDQFGIKLTEVRPMQVGEYDWNWDYLPVPTKLCDQCADRRAEGEKPACVKHCQAFCMEFGTVDEMSKRAEELGDKTALFVL